MKIFVDTNVFIDLLADRKPFSKFAIDIFDKAEKNKIQLFTSTHVFATTYYLLKKHIAEKELRSIMTSLLDYVSLIAVDTTIIIKSLKSRHKDFEDAIQITAAHTANDMDYILTRNLKDYIDSEIDAISPDQLVNHI